MELVQHLKGKSALGWLAAAGLGLSGLLGRVAQGWVFPEVRSLGAASWRVELKQELRTWCAVRHGRGETQRGGSVLCNTNAVCPLSWELQDVCGAPCGVHRDASSEDGPLRLCLCELAPRAFAMSRRVEPPGIPGRHLQQVRQRSGRGVFTAPQPARLCPLLILYICPPLSNAWLCHAAVPLLSQSKPWEHPLFRQPILFLFFPPRSHT